MIPVDYGRYRTPSENITADRPVMHQRVRDLVVQQTIICPQPLDPLRPLADRSHKHQRRPLRRVIGVHSIELFGGTFADAASLSLLSGDVEYSGEGNMSVTTTAQDTVDLFAVTPAMNRIHQSWRQDPIRCDVVELVEAHSTAYIYKLDPKEVESTCRNTEHPLGNIQKKDILQVRGATDWFPRFAFTHIFHHYLEKRQALFTWIEFSNYIFKENKVAPCWATR